MNGYTREAVYVDDVGIRYYVDIPNPLVFSIDLSVFVVKVSQKDHLQQVVGHKLEHDRFERERLALPLFFRVIENVLVDTYQAYVNVEEDGHKCKPVQVLAVVGQEVVLVPISVALFLFIGKRAFQRVKENKRNG